MRQAVAAANDEATVIIPTEPAGRIGEAEARLEVQLLDREDIARTSSASGIAKRNHKRRGYCPPIRHHTLRARLSDRKLFGQFGQESALPVVLLGARQL